MVVNRVFSCIAYVFFFFHILTSCSDSPKEDLDKSGKIFQVAVIRYQHETCTFCPGEDTNVKDWIHIRPPLEGDEVLVSGPYIRGFTSRSEEYEDIQLIGITSPFKVFGGISRSWNSEESFNYFMDLILRDLSHKMPVDGVYLALHGAMAVRNIPKPEAEIARRVRELVGKDVPIVATFDLHGNEDSEFLQWANGTFVTKRYPHYDSFIQGERAARFLRQMMRGDYVSTTATRKPPVISATVLQWTGQYPSSDIMERARRWEARQKDAFVNVFYGFPWADVTDAGTTIQVITNDNQALADSIADDMAAYIWSVREDFANGSFPKPNEAVQQTQKAINQGATPVVLADYSDRAGDATWILNELICHGVSKVLFATIRDEQVINSLISQNANPGDAFDMNVGGFTGPQAGSPVRITGRVCYFGPMWSYKHIAAIEYGEGNMLIITPAYSQIVSPEELQFSQIKPEEYDVIVVKSRVHFRRGFDETGFAQTIQIVDAPDPWFGTTQLNALNYQHMQIEQFYPYMQ